MGCAGSRVAADAGHLTDVATLARLDELERRLSALEGERAGRAAGTRKAADFAVIPAAGAGVHAAGQEARSAFLEGKWIPFLRELRALVLQAQTRTLAGFEPAERPPSAGEVRGLASRCAALTAEWYGGGRGTLSALYAWLIQVCEVTGQAGYTYEELPVVRSADGWVRVIDGQTRRKLYGGSGGGKRDSIIDTGTLPQQQGASPIDNTVLPNVLSPQESRLLLAGGHVRRVVLRSLQSRQSTHIHAVAGHVLALDEPGAQQRAARLLSMEASTEEVKAAVGQLEAAGDDVLKAKDIDPSSTSWELLKKHGTLVQSWGQIPKADQQRMHNYLKGAMLKTHSPDTGDDAGAAAPAAVGSSADSLSGQSWSELDDFLAWTKSNPGKLYRDDKTLHKRLLLLGMWRNELSVVKRSVLEKFHVHSHIVHEWTRQVPLLTIEEDGSEKILREEGSTEHSRFRKNGFPYAPSHGMGISSSGLAEDRTADGELAYEFGNALPVDHSAKLGNWFANDAEKILCEVEILNPRGDESSILPGEMWFDCGQNPKAGSSISATQHTQISASLLRCWPVFRCESKPMWVEPLNAYVDLVQIGESPDALFVSIRTRRPAALPIVSFLQDLRVVLLRKFGGRTLDFNIKAVPEGTGWFRVTFAPITMLETTDGITRNPDTGETQADARVPVSSHDTGSGQGSMLVNSAQEQALALEGQDMMIRLYDWTRKPGSRKVIRDFLLHRIAYVDRPGQARAPIVASGDTDDLVERPFAVLLGQAGAAADIRGLTGSHVP